jgi:hypothetical protein
LVSAVSSDFPLGEFLGLDELDDDCLGGHGREQLRTSEQDDRDQEQRVGEGGRDQPGAVAQARPLRLFARQSLRNLRHKLLPRIDLPARMRPNQEP